MPYDPTDRDLADRVEELTERKRGTPKSKDELDAADLWAGLIRLGDPDDEPTENERRELRRWYALENDIDLAAMTDAEIEVLDREVEQEASDGSFNPF